ncbi:MAG: RNA methyltransferase [Salinivirgaceae bacterium]|nr:RNA methyltransferase [Salinivirgaceae bacterium]
MNNKLENRSASFNMVAKTFAGLEDVLAKELDAIGAKNIKKLNRAVSFTGDKAMMYRANYWLRTALCILKPIAEFDAKDEDTYYKEIGRIDWDEYLTLDQTFAISATTHSSIFTHSQYASLKAKDAIADQFRRRKGKRPNVDTENPDLRIEIHIAEKHVTVLLNSSGEPLFKRGYRQASVKAPINEVLAAGMIMLSGWNCKSDFLDPMCGSGTLLIEAAMMAYGIAPGTYRSEFAFEKWSDFDAELFADITEETPDVPPFEHTISGSDIAPGAVKAAEINIKAAFLNKKVSVSLHNFFDLRPKNIGTIVTNPPYGERLQPNDLSIFYQKIGDKLKLDFPGYVAWIIGSNPECMKFIGLHPEQKIKLYNGQLECSFRKYSLYDGSKKDQR